MPEQAAADPHTLRLSLDSKAAVPSGPFARGGQRRTGTTGVEDDFKPQGVRTPLGLFQPQTSASALFFTDSTVSSALLADCLEQGLHERAAALKEVRRLVLDLDNGPANNGQRRQWLGRMVLLAPHYPWTVVLVYDPPSHRTYKPIERLWGIVENYGRGQLLDSAAAVLGYAAHRTYHGVHPPVRRCTEHYPQGVKRTQAQKRRRQQWHRRKPRLEKWAIDIPPPAPDQIIT